MLNVIFNILNIIDGWFAEIFSIPIRICIWGILSGVINMAIYAAISPQKSLADLKKKNQYLQRTIKSEDVIFKEYLHLSSRIIGTSFKRLIIIFGPTVISALPVLVVAVWIHIYFAYSAPGELNVLIKSVKYLPQNHNSENGAFKLEMVPIEKSINASKGGSYSSGYDEKKFMITVKDMMVYLGDPFHPPTPFIYKKIWWNIFLGSPIGYLDANAPVSIINLDLSRRCVIRRMPDWARGWEFPYIMSVFLAAFGIKIAFRIK